MSCKSLRHNSSWKKLGYGLIHVFESLQNAIQWDDSFHSRRKYSAQTQDLRLIGNLLTLLIDRTLFKTKTQNQAKWLHNKTFTKIRIWNWYEYEDLNGNICTQNIYSKLIFLGEWRDFGVLSIISTTWESLYQIKECFYYDQINIQ